MTQFKYPHSFNWRIPVALAMMLSCTVFLVAQSAMARSDMPMPGSTSGNIQFPSSAQPNESDNLLLSGAFEQGVDILSISKATAINFFGRVNYRVDTEELDFNRKFLLGVGVKLRHYFSDTFVISVGAKYEYDKRFVIERNSEGTQLFTNWFNYWQVSNSNHNTGAEPGPLAYPGLIWGEIR